MWSPVPGGRIHHLSTLEGPILWFETDRGHRDAITLLDVWPINVTIADRMHDAPFVYSVPHPVTGDLLAATIGGPYRTVTVTADRVVIYWRPLHA